MATRSAIGIKHGDIVKGVYCHWDGYLEHNGLILAKFYRDSVKVNQLISLGDISSLGASIGEKHSFRDAQPDELADTVCVFYGRDRGDSNTEFKTFSDADDFVDRMEGSGCEYFYLYDRGQWYYSTGSDWKQLEVDVIMRTLEGAL